MSTQHSKDEQLGPLLEYFAERLNQTYAYFFCSLEFADDEDFHGNPGTSDRSWVLQTIQNGCLHASLIAIRDLDDFLDPRAKLKPDDLRASDFGYPNAQRFLTESERFSINKLIAHTTTTGARSQEFRWGIWELTAKCTSQCVSFLGWVETHYSRSHFLLFTAALGCRTKTQKIHAYIAHEIQKRRKE